jgi:hypothetical protein
LKHLDMFFFISLSHIIRWKSATFSNFIIAKAPRAVAPSASAAVWQEWRTAALPHPVPSPGSLVTKRHQPQEPWSKIGHLTDKVHFQTQERWIKTLNLRVRNGKKTRNCGFRPRNLSNLQNLIHSPLMSTKETASL